MKKNISVFSFLCKSLIYPIIIMGSSVFIFSSCQKVIDINLNVKAPKIVIEAEISDMMVPKVKLSQSLNFDETNNFPPVSGALITINDNAGHSDMLLETTPGLYSSTVLTGVPGRKYTLSVTVDGNTFSASSTMPYPVEVDTITIDSMGGFGKKMYFPNIHFNDPSGTKNYYHFIEKINNKLDNTIFLYDDLLVDGDSSSIMLFNPSSGMPDPNSMNGLKQGDTLTVWLQGIDKGVYEYLSMLNQSGSGFQSASPANPTSNFSNGALGYFSAYAVRSKTIVVH